MNGRLKNNMNGVHGMNAIERCSTTPALQQGYKETSVLWCSDGQHVYTGNADNKITDEISKAIAQLIIDGAVARAGRIYK